MEKTAEEKQLEARKLINPKGNDITIFYPASGSDILSPLKNTDAKRFVFVDMEKFNEKRFGAYNKTDADGNMVQTSLRDEIVDKLNDAGARIISEKKLAEHKQKLVFDFGGRRRELIYYEADFNEIFPKELKKGYDVLFLQHVKSFYEPAFRKSYWYLKKNGKVFYTGANFLDPTVFKSSHPRKAMAALGSDTHFFGSKLSSEDFPVIFVGKKYKSAVMGEPLMRLKKAAKNPLSYLAWRKQQKKRFKENGMKLKPFQSVSYADAAESNRKWMLTYHPEVLWHNTGKRARKGKSH